MFVLYTTSNGRTTEYSRYATKAGARAAMAQQAAKYVGGQTTATKTSPDRIELRYDGPSPHARSWVLHIAEIA